MDIERSCVYEYNLVNVSVHWVSSKLFGGEDWPPKIEPKLV